MTDPASRPASNLPPPHTAYPSRAVAALSTLSSCTALLITFFGLLQLDLPIVRYQRSLTIHGLDEALQSPWMVWISDAGNWLGEGWHLLAVSLVLLAVGWTARRPTVAAAGLQSLIAQALASVLSNLLKHLIGRPRPKFVHSGEWYLMPSSFQAGWDSFPSGHTTATFAVATVLAKRFPWGAPVFIGIAIMVGLSRVLRASHFPTDVFGGCAIGVLCGSVCAHPWKAWRHSVQEGVRHAAVGTSAGFALLWTLARPADGGVSGVLLVTLGVLAVAGGLWLRRSLWREGSQTGEKASRALLAYGLACMTTAPLVIAAAGFAALGYYCGSTTETMPHGTPSSRRMFLKEAAILACLLSGLVILLEGRAVLPFQ